MTGAKELVQKMLASSVELNIPAQCRRAGARLHRRNSRSNKTARLSVDFGQARRNGRFRLSAAVQEHGSFAAIPVRTTLTQTPRLNAPLYVVEVAAGVPGATAGSTFIVRIDTRRLLISQMHIGQREEAGESRQFRLNCTGITFGHQVVARDDRERTTEGVVPVSVLRIF